MLNRLIIRDDVTILEAGKNFIITLLERHKRMYIYVLVERSFEDFGKRMNEDFGKEGLFNALSCVIDNFGIRCNKIVIYKYEIGIFYCRAYIGNGEKEAFFEINAEEAVILSVCYGVGIFCTDEVLEEGGISFDDFERVNEQEYQMYKQGKEEVKDECEKENYDCIFEQYSTDELKVILVNAIEMKEYKEAYIIRQEIERRNK